MPRDPKPFHFHRTTKNTREFKTKKDLNANERGYNYRWQLASKQFLVINPLCRSCEKEGRTTAATCVDHIVPHKGNRKVFWDQSNWQPLCEVCHGKKSAGERE